MTARQHGGSGVVFLVGAGPGDPGLLTGRGAEVLGRADVVLYDGLVNPSLLDLTPPACERIYAGKKHSTSDEPLTQDAIVDLLIARARDGKRVVRLKGGDPFVFGRGAEECRALADVGIRFEVVPGVTAATAVPAYAGIPLTARAVASTVAFATGHEAAGKPESDVDWAALARAGTVVLFMAVKTAGDCARRLIEQGKPADTPAAAIYWGTTASQKVVVSTLAALGDAVDAAAMKPPALLVIGDVVLEREHLDWLARRPLAGRRVLIARSRARAARLAAALNDLGAEPIAMPVTRTAPPTPEAGKAARIAIDRVRDADWLVFTSATAVERLWSELGVRGLDSRAVARAKIACVGGATAAALRAVGITADVVPAGRSDGRSLAAEVIASAGASIAGAHVLLPRAEDGLDDAADALTAAGARVAIAPVYRTVTADRDSAAIATGLDRLRRHQIDVCALFAPSQIDALTSVLGDDAGDALGAVGAFAAIGQTTAAALAARGLPVSIIASRPDAETLAREIGYFFTTTRRTDAIP